MTLRTSRRGLVPPFIAMDVLRAANQREAGGADVIHLEVGQPGSSAPEPVLEAARRALQVERIGYTDALGIAPLRQAIASQYYAEYGVSIDPAAVVVTTGSKSRPGVTATPVSARRRRRNPLLSRVRLEMST